MNESVARAVIVEDEPLARATIRQYLEDVEWVHLQGEAADGRTAVELIDRLGPELVFLDVQLPELSGLRVLERVAVSPAVIFTTAYDTFAVTAFELGAVDYLVKPFGPRRFHAALDRTRARLRARSAPLADRLSSLAGRPLERLFVRVGETIVPVAASEIIRIQGADDYVVVHTPAGQHLVSVRLGRLAEHLDLRRFVRVHRSHVVHLTFVTAVHVRGDRRLDVVLSDGSTVTTSRAGAGRLRVAMSPPGLKE